jgi:succinyl-CoA reductase
VLPVVPFDTEEEAVALANATKYGLQAAVYTRDYRRAMRVARAIKAGSVMINDSTRVRFDALPYGGVKMSGLAWREGVRSTMLYFTEPKFYVWRV